MECQNVHECDAAQDKIVQKSPDSSSKIVPLQLDLAIRCQLKTLLQFFPID
jgi:hypothetical protein